MKTARLLYNLLFPAVYGLMLPRFTMRMLRRGGYGPGFMQRFGFYDRALRRKLGSRRRIWIHAVSVGETGVAARYMQGLREADPSVSFVLSTTTSTGYREGTRILRGEDVIVYYPADLPWIVRRVLRIADPSAMLLTEGEMWPNMVWTASSRRIPVILVNGRLSERSYRRALRVKWLTRSVLSCVDLMLVQSKGDAERLVSLGAGISTVHVTGNAKFDLPGGGKTEDQAGWSLLEQAGMGRGDRIIVGGSTWAGEERVLVDAWRRIRTEIGGTRLVLVPRHFERADDVEREIAGMGVGVTRRSRLQAGNVPEGNVLLVDTTGELRNLYACATVVFVGKSLTAHGGQNFIEPAALGKPVITGSFLENFTDVAREFMSEDAMIQVQDAKQLEDEMLRLLREPEAARQYGQRAKDAVMKRQGVIKKSVSLIAPLALPQMNGAK